MERDLGRAFSTCHSSSEGDSESFLQTESDGLRLCFSSQLNEACSGSSRGSHRCVSPTFKSAVVRIRTSFIK